MADQTESTSPEENKKSAPANDNKTDEQPAMTTATEDQVQINLNSPNVEQDSMYRYGLLRRPIRYDPILIVFTIIIFAGGVVGYINKKSTASLVASTLFALLLIASIYLEGARKNVYPLLATLTVLTGMFFYRYSLSMIFVPSGLFGVISLLMLLRHCYLFHIRKRGTSSATLSD